MTPPRLPLTRALLLSIEVGTGRPCGLGSVPTVSYTESGPWPAAYPYAVLDALPGTFSGPPLADWHADAAWTYQVTSYGEREDQVQWLADRVRAVLFGRDGDGWVHDLEVSGMRVVDRELDYDAAGEPTQSVPDRIVSYVQRFTITVTAA